MATSTPTMPDVSTSSASTSAPSITPSSAPVSAPETAPATPATPATPAAPSLSDIVSKAADAAEKSLTKPAETVAPPPEVKPAAAETKPAEGETKPVVAETKPAAEPNPLDKLGPLPAEKITAALAEAPPEVQQYLKDKGLSVESLTENARLAAQTSQFMERFPTLEAADTALEGAQQFWKLDTGLPAVQSVEDFDKFMMETLVPMSFERDEAGNPIPDPANPGAFKNDGSIGKLIEYSANVRDSKISELAEMMVKGAATEEAKSYAADLKGAVDFLKAFIDNGYKMPGEKTEIKDLPPDLKARVERAEQTERDSKARDASTQQQALDQKENKIIDLTTKSIEPTIKAFLDKTALNDKLKARITNIVWNELTERMLKNPTYIRQRDNLSPNAPEYEQRRVALNKSYMQERIVKILEDVVGDLGGPVVDANKARQEKIESQSKASTMEPKTSGTTLQSQPALSSSEDIGKKALEMAKLKNPNASVGSREYWEAVTQLKKLPTAV